MQQQISQQLQRVNQLCAEAANLCQQAMREVQGVQQGVQSTATYNYQSSTSYQPSNSEYQSSGYGYSGGGSAAVMNADRQANLDENTPSYRNYNTQTPTYRPTQSLNYTSSVNSSAMQSVMAADRNSSSGASAAAYGTPAMTSSYGGGAGMQQSGSYQNAGAMRGVNSVMQADQQFALM